MLHHDAGKHKGHPDILPGLLEDVALGGYFFKTLFQWTPLEKTHTPQMDCVTTLHCFHKLLLMLIFFSPDK